MVILQLLAEMDKSPGRNSWQQLQAYRKHCEQDQISAQERRAARIVRTRRSSEKPPYKPVWRSLSSKYKDEIRELKTSITQAGSKIFGVLDKLGIAEEGPEWELLYLLLLQSRCLSLDSVFDQGDEHLTFIPDKKSLRILYLRYGSRNAQSIALEAVPDPVTSASTFVSVNSK